MRGEQPPAGAGRRLARTARATVAGAAPWPAGPIRAGMGLRGRRQAAGVLLIAGLPLITVALAAARGHLDLSDDLLIYLVAVVAVAIVGGFWPAVLAAITASLLLNWYFTRPLHTLTIAEPRNMLALLLFVTVAVTVSSVVHLAARRQVQAALSADEAASLLGLAQTVLGGADTPTAVLDHLTSSWGGRAELVELVRDQWVQRRGQRVRSRGRRAHSGHGQRHGRADRGRPVPADDRPPAGRVRGPGRRGAGPGPAAHPGRPGGGAGRGQPDAHRAARRGQPRPAHPARVDQGQRQHAAADRRGVDRRRTRRPCSPRSRTARTGWTR